MRKVVYSLLMGLYSLIPMGSIYNPSLNLPVIIQNAPTKFDSVLLKLNQALPPVIRATSEGNTLVLNLDADPDKKIDQATSEEKDGVEFFIILVSDSEDGKRFKLVLKEIGFDRLDLRFRNSTFVSYPLLDLHEPTE